MSYVNKEKIAELIAVVKGCNLKINEEELRNLIDYDGDTQEADDQIGLSLADNNESAHYHYSVANMGEYERTFLDLFEFALKMLGIKEYKHKYEYIESSDSDDFEICIDEKVYNYNFRYGYTSDLELLNEFSIIANSHSETRIVEVHGLDESYILFLPPDLANYLDENFTFMQKI